MRHVNEVSPRSRESWPLNGLRNGPNDEIRSGYWLFRLAIVVVAVLAWFGAAPGLYGAEPRDLILGDGATQVEVLQQNWTDAEARSYYRTPQGSKLIPYRWFLHLELVNEERLFREESHIRELGYLPRTAGSGGNPDGLPIGFTKDGEHLGLNCAACHTAQINFNGQAWLVDGAPTLGNFEAFLRELTAALDQTLNDAEKFERFASRVLPGGGSAARDKLKDDLRSVLDFRQGYNARNLPHGDSPAFGPGRVDAFGAIMNEVATTFAEVPDNYGPANAPVSYPFLWDTPQHDKVQWNGSAPNTDIGALRFVVGTQHVGALARNAGEVMGVFGQVNASDEGGLLNLFGYPSSVNRPNLIETEELLRKLWSPQWPDELPPIDETLRAKGAALFDTHCQSCHNAIIRDDPARRVVARMSNVGSDPMMAANFAHRTSQTGVVEGRGSTLPGTRPLGAIVATKDLLVHMVTRVVVRRPLTPEISGLADRVSFPVSLIDPGEDAANGEPGELTAEQASAALETLAQWNPEYRIFAEIRVKGKTLTGGFSHLEFEEGRIRRADIPEGLRLVEDAKSFRLDSASSDPQGRLVAPDGEVQSLAAVSGVDHTFSAAGTRLTFSEDAEVALQYKGRPLNGIWATSPYLHNGSVPNLDELLKPADQRVTRFHVGSRELDPIKVGFTNAGDFEFDTTLPGNSNAGHEYGQTVFTAEERRALIEYMKSL